MKMEKTIRSVSECENGRISLESLHRQLGIELFALAGLCENVEVALGEMIEHPENVLDQPVVTFQGLDRLRQSLQDMARLANFLSHHRSARLEDEISAEAVREIIILAGLADRLTMQKQNIATENYSDQDVIWT